MFVREKRINGYTYLYLVENVREDGRAKQRIIKNLGRKEAVVASGGLERLAGSIARYAERALVLSRLEAGNPDRLACKRIGAPLLFGRLWEETGCKAVIEGLLAGRGFEFAAERAVFATVLHRLMAPGSDRACERWLGDYDVPGADGLALHHLYRAMAWLGEELPPDQQQGATPFAPRATLLHGSARGRSEPILARGHAMRTDSGRPSSSMRFSTPTAMATSVACRPSVCERSVSPITRL